MMLAFRRWLGRLQGRLENRAATLASGGQGNAPGSSQPISEMDRSLLLDWISGKIDDRALFAQARARADGLSLLERACAVRSGNPHVWAARAQMCLEQGELPGAVEHARHAYVLGRHEPQVGLLLVQVLAAAGRRDEALRIVPLALQNAKRMRAHANRLQLCREWQALEPDSIETRIEMGRTHVAAGAVDEAITQFEGLLTRHGPRTDVLMLLGAIYQDLLRLEDALRIYQQAAEVDPANVDAIYMVGHCALALADVGLADRCLSRAVELDPHSILAQYDLGLLRFEQQRVEEAVGLLQGARDARRGEPWPQAELAARLKVPVERDVADPDWANARCKLDHDIEQFGYLRARGIFGADLDPVIAAYRAALRDPFLSDDASRMVALEPKKYPLLARTFKAPLHAPDPPPPPGTLLNPDLAWREIENDYLAAKPALIVIDNLLSADALEALRAFCLESTIWNELKGGYLGAEMPDGFCSRLLLGIAAQLRARMPRVMRDHRLRTMWGYKYDSRYPGIDVHADVAAVNVNFWITPDAANLDPQSGGLVVYNYDTSANRNVRRLLADSAQIHRYLESIGSAKINIPYRANRAVIFDSDLFHATDALNFRPGYENRRVSITMLYGMRAA